MARTVIAEWEGREYDHTPRSADWYWALGILSVAGTIAAVLFGSFLIATLIVIAAAAVALHASKKPPIHTFQLTDEGLLISEHLHPFDTILSFSFLEDIEGELPPMLSLKTNTWHSPHLLIPLDGVDEDLVYEYFLHNVEEAEHPYGLIDLVALWLGF